MKISPAFSPFLTFPISQLTLRPVIYSQFILKLKTRFLCLETRGIFRISENRASPSSLLQRHSRYFCIAWKAFLGCDLQLSYLLQFLKTLLEIATCSTSELGINFRYAASIAWERDRCLKSNEVENKRINVNIGYRYVTRCQRLLSGLAACVRSH